MKSSHLVVAISAHGYGHATQVSNVVNEFIRRNPATKLTIKTSVSEEFLTRIFTLPFELVPVPVDIGMTMSNALNVLPDESAHAYAEYHACWGRKLETEKRWLDEIDPTLVLGNVPYTVLAAATELGIPAVAVGSLNWADIYSHYCGQLPGTSAIHQQMLSAYNAADLFLRLQPALPMTDLANTVEVGPVARIGNDRRGEIKQRLRLDDRSR